MPAGTKAITARVSLRRLGAALIAQARAARHRRAAVLAGEPEWCLEAADAMLDGAACDGVLWVSRRAPAGTWALSGSRTLEALGRELDAVVFDAYSGFDLDGFGAVAGTIRGGGLLLLLAPPLAAWPDFPEPEQARIAVAGYPAGAVTGRFLRRLVRVIRDEGVTIVEQHSPVPAVELASPTAVTALAQPAGSDPECRTPDQRRAVEAIVHVVTGQRRRPVVLTSDRGRGKSAALGIAAARLLRSGTRHIVVTAPQLAAAAAVFEQVHRLLPQAAASRAALHFGAARLEFAPPDELVHTPRPADLLLVDEAAAIATPLLEQLLQRYSRVAYATTVHGYEGTGRGFGVRFNKVLDERTRGWKALRLETPIRWAPNDPVERFVFRALLLDASAAPDPVAAQATPANTVLRRLDRDRLVDDECTLGELFGLLVLAHYRTRPYDLRHLLDGPNLSIHVLCHDKHVVATALVATEGGFDAETAWAIWEGRTRPHGHLIPESLAAHVGLEQAPRLLGARIMRIAVHPAAQGRGLGTRLLAAIVADARATGLDYIGSSFGASDELLHFWERSGLLPVRLSVKRGATSGAHSAIVLGPLSTAGDMLVAKARERFLDQFPHQLSDPLRELQPHLAARLLRYALPGPPPALDRHDWRDVTAFAFGHRVYEACLAPLWKLACAGLAHPRSTELLSSTDRDVLALKLLQKRSWQESAAAAGMAGRADVIEALRRAMRPLVLAMGDAEVRREAERLQRAVRVRGGMAGGARQPPTGT